VPKQRKLLIGKKDQQKDSTSSKKNNDFRGLMTNHPRIKNITLETGLWMREKEMSDSIKTKESK